MNQEAYETYLRFRRRLKALQYAEFLTDWDNQTEAPAGAAGNEAEAQGELAALQYEISTDPAFTEAVETLYAERDSLDELMQHEIVETRRQLERDRRIPKDELVRQKALLSRAYGVYVDAKRTNDFAKFAPYLEQILSYVKKTCGWLETEKLHGYDVLLDQFEPGFTRQEYDRFFEVLRRRLVPFVKKITALKPDYDRSFADKIYPVDAQRAFCEYLRRALCFDTSRGVMKESEHPFTSNFTTDDVRITVHYYPELFSSSIFSVIHETGHALYEQQCDPALNATFSGGGASMGLHESQSRLYENMIGRSEAFWEAHYGKLQETFPEQLVGVPLEDFVRYINTAEMSFIRTEADELTYPLHIMLRYQMEQDYIENGLAVSDFPSHWNRLFTEYFGITPPTDTEGVLQDVHWAYGEMGYFPTYALGSAYAAQIYAAMSRELDIDEALRSGSTRAVNDWLREHVHRYGSSKYPKEILRLATGEDFDPNYYVDYLIGKYSRIYGVGE